MNQPTTSAPEGEENRNNDEVSTETNPPQDQGLEEPRSSAQLLVEILAVLLALGYFVLLISKKSGIF